VFENSLYKYRRLTESCRACLREELGMESHWKSDRQLGVGDGLHGVCVDHQEAVQADLLVEHRNDNEAIVFYFGLRVVNKVGLTDINALLLPASDGVAIAVVNFEDGCLVDLEEHFGDVGVAVLLSLDCRVDDGEAVGVEFRSQDVVESDFFSLQIDFVPSEYVTHGEALTVVVLEPPHTEHSEWV